MGTPVFNFVPIPIAQMGIPIPIPMGNGKTGGKSVPAGH